MGMGLGLGLGMPYVGSSSGGLLQRALAYWKVSRYSGTGDLLDLSGGGRNAQLGSTSGSDANDPVWLPYAGTAHLYLPDSAGNYASVPDAAALDITGDIDLRADLALNNWASGAQAVFAKESSGVTRSYRLQLSTIGQIQLVASTDGSGAFTATSSAVVGFANELRRWIRATWRQSDGRVQFFTSSDGSAWTQLGTDQSILIASLFNSTSPLEVGGTLLNTANRMAGRVYRVQAFASLNDTDKRIDIDFTSAASYNADRTSLTAVTGQTVTLNRTATTTARRAEVVEIPLLSYAVDDYITVAHDAACNPAAATFCAAIAFRKYGNTGSSQHLYGNRGTSGNGWAIYLDSSGRVYGYAETGGVGASTLASPLVTTDGTIYIAVLVLDRTAQTLTMYLLDKTGAVVGTSASASTAAMGSITVANPLRVGASASATFPCALTSISHTIFPGVLLTPTDWPRLATELLAA